MPLDFDLQNVHLADEANYSDYYSTFELQRQARELLATALDEMTAQPASGNTN